MSSVPSDVLLRAGSAHRSFAGMEWIPGGTFIMGSDSHYSEEGPTHRVEVDGFWIDRNAVTNSEFAEFIAATGYITLAERLIDAAAYPDADPRLLQPGSAVFRRPAGRVDMRDPRNWWAHVPGASWKQPEGFASSILGREQEPVVHVGFEDAVAYAAWAGRDLPTEAEWERAARGGLDAAPFCWGDEFNPDGRWMANTWQGEFPWQNLELDGFAGRAPVSSFPPNPYGLYDMAGNVWEWTSDWYAERGPRDRRKRCCVVRNPRGVAEDHSHEPAQPGPRIPRKVIKGGSYLCAPNYCRRYRPAARHPQPVDSPTCHIGFRCVVRP